MVRAYNDPEYRTAKRWLMTNVVQCWRGCGNRATSPDHDPPLSDHPHVRGSGCCRP